MAGLTSTLEIAKNTLLNQQLMIQTATNNIANADNRYYARQQVHLTTSPPSRIAAGWIGNGTQVELIAQVRDQYLDRQLLASQSQESDYRTRSTLLGAISAHLSDNSAGGLSQVLGAFWDSWDALSRNPQGLVEKDGVLASTRDLVTSIHNAGTALIEARQDIASQIGDATHGMVLKINDLLAQIGDLNQRITGHEAAGQPANDLRDLRYRALSELSQYLGISYSEQPNGTVSVTMTDDTTVIQLVTNQSHGTLQYDAATRVVSYVDAAGTAVSPAANRLEGGSLSGVMHTLGRIDAYESQLNAFASQLVASVNGAYFPTAGANLFDPAATTATTIAISAALTSSAGIDGDAALAVASLQDAPVLAGGSLGQSLSRLQAQIGQDQQSAVSRADFHQGLVIDLQAQQQSVSGVSIDEETIDLLKFQQVYSAAAKIVQRTVEMLRSVIDMV
jgi:flagellar hook-associated protein 1